MHIIVSVYVQNRTKQIVCTCASGFSEQRATTVAMGFYIDRSPLVSRILSYLYVFRKLDPPRILLVSVSVCVRIGPTVLMEGFAEHRACIMQTPELVSRPCCRAGGASIRTSLSALLSASASGACIQTSVIVSTSINRSIDRPIDRLQSRREWELLLRDVGRFCSRETSYKMLFDRGSTASSSQTYALHGVFP
jgi:hypothetical protein